MFVKLMSDENAPDQDSRKEFRLLADVTAVIFKRRVEAPVEDDTPHAIVIFKDMTVESYPLVGNAYILNDEGKTIEKFGVAPLAPKDHPTKA